MTTSRSYWNETRRLTASLVALWFFFTFGTIFFARELSGLRFFGWPLSQTFIGLDGRNGSCTK